MSEGQRKWALRLLWLAAEACLVAAGVVLFRKSPALVGLVVLPAAGGVWWARQPAVHRIGLAGDPVLDGGGSINTLLEETRQIFQSEVAALAWFPPGLPEAAAVTVSGSGGGSRRTGAGPRSSRREVWTALVPGRGPRIVTDVAEIRRLGVALGHPHLRQAMVVPLCGDVAVIGFVVVADPKARTQYNPDDLDVLDTLGCSVAVGLENGQLEQSVARARLLERQLVHRATHDSLTGLANRALLADHITRRIEEDAAANLSLLLVDVEQHRIIDSGSSEATVDEVRDQLLVIAAQRLIGSLRDGDVAARMGDRELAVVARVAPDGGEEATRLGERIMGSLSRPATVSGATVALVPTVAVVLGRPFDDCSDLLTAADLGLIAAKASSGGRVELVTR